MTQPVTQEPTRKELWQCMDGCKCPPLGKDPKYPGSNIKKSDRCTKTAIRCQARLNAVRKQYEKYKYTWGPPR
jgi:hypothetical protein